MCLANKPPKREHATLVMESGWNHPFPTIPLILCNHVRTYLKSKISCFFINGTEEWTQHGSLIFCLVLLTKIFLGTYFRMALTRTCRISSEFWSWLCHQFTPWPTSPCGNISCFESTQLLWLIMLIIQSLQFISAFYNLSKKYLRPKKQNWAQRISKMVHS